MDGSVAVDTYKTSLSACVAVEEIVLNNMPARYMVTSMSQIHDSRYVMRMYDCDAKTNTTYDADIDTHDIAKIDDYGDVQCIITRDDIAVVFKRYAIATVLHNRGDAGHIDVKFKYRHASGCHKRDRYCQQTDDDIYAVDTSNKLWRVWWHDVKARRYDVKCLIDDDVEDFYMHEHGNAILKTTGIIALSGGQSTNMQEIDGVAKGRQLSGQLIDRSHVAIKKTCLLSLVSTIEAL